MIVSCPSNSIWEMYVLDQDCERRAELTRHLTTCWACRIVVAEYAELWQSLSQVAKLRERAQVIFALGPVETDTADMEVSRMAAEGTGVNAEPGGLTLATSDRQMWLKVVHDNATQEVWIYLYSDDKLLDTRNAIVKPLGMEQEFVTDEHGRVNLGRIPWPETTNLRTEVRLPRATFHLEDVGDLDSPDGETELISQQGDRIRVFWKRHEHGSQLSLEILQLKGIDASASLLAVARTQRGPVAVSMHPVAVGMPESLGEFELPAKVDIFLY